MTITVNYLTKVIFIPQADLDLVSGTLYEMDLEAFRLVLADIQDSEEGIAFDTMYLHNSEVSILGITLARVFLLINDYAVEFEDGQYTVRLFGANTNLFSVEDGNLIQNQVQIIGNNSAGLANPRVLIDVDERLVEVLKILLNKFVTDPVTGLATIFEDDDATPFRQSQLFEDAAGTIPYRGRGAERRERLL